MKVSIENLYTVRSTAVQLRTPLDAIACGFPSPAQDYDDGPIDLTQILIDDEAATFLVRAAGSSMIDAGIYDGDVLLVDRSKTPQPEDVVVAILAGEYTIKRLVRRRGTWALHAENVAHPDIVVDELSSLEVWGVVTVSFRFHRPPPR